MPKKNEKQLIENEVSPVMEEENLEEENAIAPSIEEKALVSEETPVESVEAEPLPEEEIKPKKKKARSKKKRRTMRDFANGQDIKYRGPLSYRYLRILAWIFFALGQVAIIMTTAGRLDAGFAKQTAGAVDFFASVRALSTPLFLLASFAIILDVKKGYRNTLILYGSLTAIVYLAFVFVHEHYFIGIASMVAETPSEARSFIDKILNALSSNGYISFNIFVDLFLCSAFMFFLTYKPVRYFSGKKIIIFRLLALLPIGYEIISIILKTASAFGKFTLSPFVYPFLTTKSPILFIVFILFAFFIKFREFFFIKRGGTHEEYQRFLKTNANSLHFSIYAAIMFVLAAIADFALTIGISMAITQNFIKGGIEASEAAARAVTLVRGLGYSTAYPFLFLSPLMLLFSYTKTHKSFRPDAYIAAGGVGLVVFVYIEGIYWVIRMAPQILQNLLK